MVVFVFVFVCVSSILDNPNDKDKIDEILQYPSNQAVAFMGGLKNAVLKHNVVCSRRLSARATRQYQRLLFVTKMNERD